jgi:hypothetical protein
VNLRTQTLRLISLLACMVAAGCGSDEGEPIPAEQAAALQTQLDSIESRFQNGDAACRDITEGDDTNTDAVDNILASLPEDVDPDVRDAVTQSFDRLFELTSEQCAEEPQEPTDTTPTETQTTTTETTTTETIETETTPIETTPTETTPTDTTGDETSPSGDEGGDGGGIGAPGDEG